MLRRQQKLNLIDDKPAKLAFLRISLMVAVILIVIVTIIGMLVFSSVHGCVAP
jgi:hypothetical protein